VNGSAKRIDSSKTASDEREKVSHWQMIMSITSAEDEKRYHHLLSIKYIVITPELADGKCLTQTTVLVSLSEKPGSIHKILS
jgi:hypothetical protein